MNNSMNNKVGGGAMVGALLTIAFCGPLHAGSDDTCGATRGPVRFSGLISGGDVLPPLAGVQAIASGWHHGVAILEDGSLAFWGDDSKGQCSPPEGVGFGSRRVVDVAAGESHTIALLANGSVVCWGSNEYGQLDIPDQLLVADSNNPIIQVDAGNWYSALLRADGSVLQWGEHAPGCGGGEPDPENPIVRISCGATITAVLRADGIWSQLCSDLIPPNDQPILDVVITGGAFENYVIGLSPDGNLLSVNYAQGVWYDFFSLPLPCIQIAGCAGNYAFLLEDGTVSFLFINQTMELRSDQFVDAIDLQQGLSSRKQIALGAYHLMALVQEGDCDGSGIADADEIADGTVPDCDGNLIPDSCDIARGVADVNGNGIPDECELSRGDLNLDGCIDGADLGLFLTAWTLPGSPIGDLDGNGVIDGADLGLLLGRWGCG